jgi:peptidoglycan/LPS O-acetylase OafA/YrhL
MARFGFLRPLATGVALVVLLGYFSEGLTPFGLFFVITAFANLTPSEETWWRKPATMLGDASYSIYLIHPMVFSPRRRSSANFPMRRFGFKSRSDSFVSGRPSPSRC